MPEATDIYINNFIEALKQLQRYLIFGFSSSLFFFIFVESRALIEAEGKGVSLPGFLPTNPILAGWIVLAASFVSGGLANFAFLDVEKIVAQLREKRETLLAILTYPSIATSWHRGPRLGITLLPPVLLVIALPSWLQGLGFPTRYRVLALCLFCLPYLLLALHLRKPVGYYELALMSDKQPPGG